MWRPERERHSRRGADGGAVASGRAGFSRADRHEPEACHGVGSNAKLEAPTGEADLWICWSSLEILLDGLAELLRRDGFVGVEEFDVERPSKLGQQICRQEHIDRP